MLDQTARCVAIGTAGRCGCRSLDTVCSMKPMPTSYWRCRAALAPLLLCLPSVSIATTKRGTPDEASEVSIPMMPVPIPETHRTIPPGPLTYSTRKVALEQSFSATLRLRDHSTSRRDLWARGASLHENGGLCKRILDGRRQMPLVIRRKPLHHHIRRKPGGHNSNRARKSRHPHSECGRSRDRHCL